MRFYTDEVLAISGTAVGLTRSNIDHTGGSKAERAVIQVKDKPIHFSFNTTPDSTHSFDADIGDTITIDGYDNLTQVKFITQDASPSSIYVGYET